MSEPTAPYSIRIRNACWEPTLSENAQPCRYALRETDPVCTGCAYRPEDAELMTELTDHFSETTNMMAPPDHAAKWDERFMAMAQLAASWSKDPSTKCGAIIASPDQRLIAQGYNGLPAGVPDDPALLADRAKRLALTIHAEENAILHSGGALAGCTLYVWPMPPCSQCAAKIVQAGIRRIVAGAPTAAQSERWGAGWALADWLYRQVGARLEIVAK